MLLGADGAAFAAAPHARRRAWAILATSLAVRRGRRPARGPGLAGGDEVHPPGARGRSRRCCSCFVAQQLAPVSRSPSAGSAASRSGPSLAGRQRRGAEGHRPGCPASAHSSATQISWAPFTYAVVLTIVDRWWCSGAPRRASSPPHARSSTDAHRPARRRASALAIIGGGARRSRGAAPGLAGGASWLPRATWARWPLRPRRHVGNEPRPERARWWPPPRSPAGGDSRSRWRSSSRFLRTGSQLPVGHGRCRPQNRRRGPGDARAARAAGDRGLSAATEGKVVNAIWGRDHVGLHVGQAPMMWFSTLLAFAAIGEDRRAPARRTSPWRGSDPTGGTTAALGSAPPMNAALVPCSESRRPRVDRAGQHGPPFRHEPAPVVGRTLNVLAIGLTAFSMPRSIAIRN